MESKGRLLAGLLLVAALPKLRLTALRRPAWLMKRVAGILSSPMSALPSK
ncbi:hypothetical protein NKJ46_18525 [Mesorhizobium sp. M0166]